MKGVLVFLAAKSGFMSNADEAADLQNFVLCVEMLLAAVGHLYAFPYKEYAGANIGGSSGLIGSFSHALKFNDFYHDTVHQVNQPVLIFDSLLWILFLFVFWNIIFLAQFAPTYHDYVLYNSTESDDGARKYRSRTFVPTGQEMDTVRKNRQMYGGKLDDIQLSSVSTSSSNSPAASNASPDLVDLELIKSSLLKESSAQPYDLSILLDTELSNYPSKVPSVENPSRWWSSLVTS